MDVKREPLNSETRTAPLSAPPSLALLSSASHTAVNSAQSSSEKGGTIMLHNTTRKDALDNVNRPTRAFTSLPFRALKTEPEDEECEQTTIIRDYPLDIHPIKQEIVEECGVNDEEVIEESDSEMNEDTEDDRKLDDIEQESTSDANRQRAGKQTRCRRVCNKKQVLKKHIKGLCQTNEAGHACTVCGMVFNRNQACLLHILHTHIGEKPYACELCGKAFKNMKYLNLHKASHSDERPYPCDICGKTFKSRDYLTRHKISHSDERPYACDICGKTFKVSQDVTRHKVYHSDERPYSCDICGKAFKGNSEVTKHMSTCHSNERPYSCDACGKSFKALAYLTKHKLLTCHKMERPYSCDVCGKAFKLAAHLTIHRASHSEERPYSCDVCGKTFKAVSYLTKHKHHHADEFNVLGNTSKKCAGKQDKASCSNEPRPCDTFEEDGENAAKPYLFNIPIKVEITEEQHSMEDEVNQLKTSQVEDGEAETNEHTNSLCDDSVVKSENNELLQNVDDMGMNEEDCISDTITAEIDRQEICSRAATKEKQILKDRSRERLCHTSETGFVTCSVCGMVFSTNQSCLLHILHTHEAEKPYSCELCGKVFAHTHDLSQHKQLCHSDEKPHYCDMCGKSFKLRSDLKLHKVSHSKEASYSCDVCGKTFKVMVHLTKHKVCHSNERPYSCEVCGRAFKLGAHLNKHRDSHSDERPYSCDVCGKAFKRCADMKQHTASHVEGSQSNEQPQRNDPCLESSENTVKPLDTTKIVFTYSKLTNLRRKQQLTNE